MADLDSLLLQATDKLAVALDSPEVWDQVVSKAQELVVNSRAEMVASLLLARLRDNNPEAEKYLDRGEVQTFQFLRPQSHSLLVPPPPSPEA